MEAVTDGQRWPPSKFVGKAFLGGRLALLESVGQRAIAHSIHGMECAREVRAAWRAPFLPDSEDAGDYAG